MTSHQHQALWWSSQNHKAYNINSSSGNGFGHYKLQAGIQHMGC